MPRPTKKKTLTVRLSPEEKAQAEAVAEYLNLPVTTFLKYAAKEAFNARLAELREAGLWPQLPEPDDAELPDVPSRANRAAETGTEER